MGLCCPSLTLCCPWGGKALQLSLAGVLRWRGWKGAWKATQPCSSPWARRHPAPQEWFGLQGLSLLFPWLILTPFASTNKATDVLCAIQLN